MTGEWKPQDILKAASQTTWLGTDAGNQLRVYRRGLQWRWTVRGPTGFLLIGFGCGSLGAAMEAAEQASSLLLWEYVDDCQSEKRA